MTHSWTNACRRSLVPAALLIGLAGAARADEVTDWHEHMLTALGTAGTNPTFSSREAALVSAAVFDAVNGIERRYAPIHVVPAALPGASQRAAAVQAAYAVLVSRFPAQAADLAAKRTASLAAIGDGKGESCLRGVAWGQTVAESILAWRSTDGFTPTPPAYLGADLVGRWRPTPPALASGVGPQFATMTPWTILSPDQFLPAGPPALTSARYLADFNEVKSMGSVGSTLRSADQTDACRFWAASSATYFFNTAAIKLNKAADASLSQNAHLLATMNVAVADAIIACWNAKYFYEFWRPITAIRLASTDGNPDTAEDASWTPLLATPAHPEYVSGHSSASSAAVTVLTDLFGDATSFTLHPQTDAAWVRSFTSFSQAIDEVADARVFAGIHFRSACTDGVATGAAVAEYVMENAFKRVHGKGE